jgi:seryl-tRNA synthetase
VLDIKRIRSEPDVVRHELSRRHIDLAELEEVIKLDTELRGVISERDETRGKIKNVSEKVGAAKRSGNEKEADSLAEESRKLREHEEALADNADLLETRMQQLLLVIPNTPYKDAPDGESEEDNPLVEQNPKSLPKYGEHQRVPHWEIGERLGVLDLERGAKISGSMFAVFRRGGATLVRALCQYALDSNADAYEEIRPPTLVRTATLTATGHLPKFHEDAYAIERDDLWAIPTAEVPLTSLAKDEILDEASLPTKMMAYSPCLRREAGSAGRDTRGLLRVHEFDKVELLGYATPEQAPAVLDDILARAKNLVSSLELPYRIVEICTGDMGQSHHRSFDVEVYSPGVDKWLEVSSCSWYGDYQARRANIRFRPKEGGSPQTVHTINGSALAVPRIFAAILETFHHKDGSVKIPKVLHPYMRGQKTLSL